MDQPPQSLRQDRLRRQLRLRDLVFYGIVLVQPIAPVGIFGLANRISGGHASATILLAAVAMMVTARSYGHMASLYPAAGSAYTYVGRGLNPHLGFLVGWAMVLDYLIVPVISIIYAALTLGRIAPAIPYSLLVVVLSIAVTLLNLRGIRATARANDLLLLIMTVVILMFVITAVRVVFHQAGWDGLFSIAPFYSAASFRPAALFTATSLAALTYTGFDGVTTLAEEVENPRRNVQLAPVLVCLVTAVFSLAEVYLAQRVWPDDRTFPSVETAFMDVTRRAGGNLLFDAMGAILILACVGSSLTGQAGAARLLYGMGRDSVLPRSVFGRLHARSGVPALNLIILGVLTVSASLAVSYERSAELLNFGAFLAFMGVNLASLRRRIAERRAGEASAWTFLSPAAGFLFCAAIWINLPEPSKVAGGTWLLAGLIWYAVITRGFRAEPAALNFTES